MLDLSSIKKPTSSRNNSAEKRKGGGAQKKDVDVAKKALSKLSQDCIGCMHVRALALTACIHVCSVANSKCMGNAWCLAFASFIWLFGAAPVKSHLQRTTQGWLGVPKKVSPNTCKFEAEK